MSAVIDTSVLARPGGIVEELDEDWAISVITVGELEAGVLLAVDPATRAARLRRLSAILAEAPTLPVDRATAAHYGELRAHTGRRPTNDLWIAATAMARDLTLVTHDAQQAALPLVRTRLLS